MQFPDVELTKKCTHCADTGKKWVDKNWNQVAPYDWEKNDKKNPIRETNEVCPYCLGSTFEPNNFGLEIIQFVKKYLNVKT